MKKLLSLTLAIIMLLSFAGCAAAPAAAPAAPAEPAAAEQEAQASAPAPADAVEIKLAVATTGENPLAVFARAVEAAVEEKSGGAMQVTVYDNGSLGGERDMSEGVQMGTIEMMCVIPESAFASFVPAMQVLALPFLIKDRDHAFRILDDPGFRAYVEPLYEAANYKLLGFSELGFRQTTNSKRRVTSAQDMEGLTLRVMESPIWYKTAVAMGVTPTAISFSELYTSLQQGVIDGQDNPITTIATSKFYEIQKYLVLNNQTFGTTSVVSNLAFYNGLSEEQRTILNEACAEAVQVARKTVADNESRFLDEIRASGIDIVEDPDMDSFVAATAAIYEDPEVVGIVGQDLIDLVKGID